MTPTFTALRRKCERMTLIQLQSMYPIFQCIYFHLKMCIITPDDLFLEM